MNVADYFVDTLVGHGVKHVFAFPGTPIMPIFHSIDQRTDIARITLRHEAAVSLAASAQAKLTHSLGVCLATSGPGATNMVTGVADAHLDRVPMLAITGILPTWKQGRREFQDVDQTQLYQAITGKSMECKSAEQFPSLLKQCIGYAEKYRDAVHLAIPLDILETKIDPHNNLYQVTQQPQRHILLSAPKEAYKLVANEINQANKVCIVVGSQALGAGEYIEKLSERIGAPILCSFPAKGIIHEEHPNYTGVFGVFSRAGSSLSQLIVDHADTILTFGVTDLVTFVSDEKGLQNKHIIMCQPDFSILNYHFRHLKSLFGPLDVAVKQLIRYVKSKPKTDLLDEMHRLKEKYMVPVNLNDSLNEELDSFVHPAKIFKELNRYLDKNSLITIDVGDNGLWAQRYLSLQHRQRVLVSNKLGSMGFAMPAAIAVKLMQPEKTVVAICGDGGMQMYMAELNSAIQYDVSFILIILKNNSLGRVSRAKGKDYWVEIKNPNFVEVARGCGCDGVVVNNDHDLELAMKSAFQVHTGPYVVEINIDPHLLPSRTIVGY